MSGKISKEMVRILKYVYEVHRIPSNAGKMNRPEFLNIRDVLYRLNELSPADAKEHEEWRHYAENFAKPGSTRLNGEAW